MKKLILPVNFILILLGLLSCRSYKKLIYMQDVNGHEFLSGGAANIPVYKIRQKDNLYINIISPNPDLNKKYNPVEAGTNGLALSSQYENQQEQFINGYTVDDKGDLTLPAIGKINVAGKTLAEAQSDIETRAATFLKDVIVKVKLLSFRVTVIGEVKLPGVYYNYNDNFSVLNAIASANGNTDYANLNKVLVLRPTATGSETFTLDMQSKQVVNSPAFYLLPNDVVVVQPDKNKNTQISISTAALVLSTITSVFLILNYVRK
ncbi:hypothetical protein FO440_14750 [Mucilaginibacter corticis]|uniref:Sugar transporter n=1 Tax=Mucilaginibacter corticis TaxID=2597670 RepID=A0A556MM54_9SPHI|nr:polysaccharide biosynthesis/export family protein [Mucilaginibacter corticis]TSJ40990.1 hypothetical protein FO440_14750 [Mucilaginibacter corticis]